MSLYYPLAPLCMDGVATKVLAVVGAVVAAAACFRSLRAQLAATTREIEMLCDKLAQQQAPPAPPAPVAHGVVCACWASGFPYSPKEDHGRLVSSSRL